jgi:hypothetical protein
MNEGILKITLPVAVALLSFPIAAWAEDCGHCNIDYSKLNLTQEQTVKIQQCDQEWFQEYQQTQPEIQGLQQKFRRLIASEKPDATEIMLVQQQIEAKKSKLKMKATQILLKKQQILDENQKKQFDTQIQSEIVKRRQQGSGVETNAQPERWRKIWTNMQNIFNQEH